LRIIRDNNGHKVANDFFAKKVTTNVKKLKVKVKIRTALGLATKYKHSVWESHAKATSQI